MGEILYLNDEQGTLDFMKEHVNNIVEGTNNAQAAISSIIKTLQVLVHGLEQCTYTENSFTENVVTVVKAAKILAKQDDAWAEYLASLKTQVIEARRVCRVTLDMLGIVATGDNGSDEAAALSSFAEAVATQVDAIEEKLINLQGNISIGLKAAMIH